MELSQDRVSGSLQKINDTTCAVTCNRCGRKKVVEGNFNKPSVVMVELMAIEWQMNKLYGFICPTCRKQIQIKSIEMKPLKIA